MGRETDDMEKYISKFAKWFLYTDEKIGSSTLLTSIKSEGWFYTIDSIDISKDRTP